MTFSLAGRSVRTGMLGGVITTSSPAVGSRCLHARAGIGVVLTQNRTDPALGPRGLDLLAAGCDAAHSVAALVASTPHHGWRQLAVLGAAGPGTAFSGSLIRSVHDSAVGRDCVAAGNILADPGVPTAMIAAFDAASHLDLPERLLAAIEAGDAAGGEVLALRSAALMVVHDQPFPFVDLRVDAADAPIAALRALWDEYKPEADLYVIRALDPGRAGDPAA